MKAWVFTKAGLPKDVLSLRTDWPQPVPTKKQVLVKVAACSYNPVGWKTMSTFPMTWMMKKPAVPEADVSGVVAGGDLVDSGFKIGDEVFGMIPYDTVMKTGAGTLAEYAVVEPDLLAHKPNTISHAEAAAFPLAGLTSYAALVRTGGLKRGAGQRVFINGGSGGVGAWAVQLAKVYGAHVVTTCSPSSKSLVSSLGADELIDYRAVDLVKHLSKTYNEDKFDIIFDTVGVGELFYASPAYLKPNGPFLDIAGPHMDGSLSSTLSGAAQLVSRKIRPVLFGGTPRPYHFVLLHANTYGEELKEAAALLTQGKLKAVVEEEFAFEDALAAYERSMSGRAKGKVVVLVH